MGKFNRMDDPTIYDYHLNENSTRYDYPRAWPSHDILYIQFSGLAVINAIVATGVLIFLIAYWRSPTVRGNTFNLYLFFVALPDFLVSFFCLLTCAMSAKKGEFFSEQMCGFQAWYLCWAFASNAWLNGVITHQVHRLLANSNVRMRYKPPTKKDVCIQAGLVYLYAATWGFFNAFGAGIPGFPHESHLYYGFACHGMEHDLPSALFFWLCFIPMYMGIPLCYAIYVVIDIWRRDLLPPTGRRRNISIFLLRLCFLYFVIWFPYLLLSLVGNFVILGTWLLWSGAAASHLQGLISVCFCMTNNEIRRAVWETVTCQPADDSPRRSTWMLRLSLNRMRSTQASTSRFSQTMRSARLWSGPFLRSSRSGDGLAASSRDFASKDFVSKDFSLKNGATDKMDGTSKATFANRSSRESTTQPAGSSSVLESRASNNQDNAPVDLEQVQEGIAESSGGDIESIADLGLSGSNIDIVASSDNDSLDEESRKVIEGVERSGCDEIGANSIDIKCKG